MFPEYLLILKAECLKSVDPVFIWIFLEGNFEIVTELICLN